VEEAMPATKLCLLRMIHQRLSGDELALPNKR